MRDETRPRWHNVRIRFPSEIVMANLASGQQNQPSGTGAADPQTVRIQLQKILSSTGFAGAERLRRFLEFVVTRTLEGQADQLKESVIGVEVFEKPNFDPKSDAA